MMSQIDLLIFCVFGLISACVGQILQFGQCNDAIQLQQDFNLEQYSGTWYEIYRSDNPNQNGECASYEFTRLDATRSNVRYSTVNKNFQQQSSGVASVAAGTAKISLDSTFSTRPTEFWVLSTDYETFSVNYACQNVSDTQRSVHIWVLGRTRQLTSPMAVPLINTLLNNLLSINVAMLQTVDHSNQACYVLPVIQAGRPVILPGQCDPRITVVQNFSAADFLGVWHVIASYESVNSVGACARAQYSVAEDGGPVIVFNSEVVNQRLSTITGTAVVSSTDQSAKLTVSLNVGTGIRTRDLWIIATDYKNFAISYACRDVSNTEKEVVSWIVSRTRRMPASVKAEVDKVVDSIIDLNYQYYQEMDQSDAACFYYPDPIPNQPVIFGGQCESVAVNAMTNFNANAYMGKWHTIELYPDEFQGGTCSNANYTLVDGRVDVYNTQVVNQALDTIRAVAVPATNDGRAKLLVTFPIAGTDLTITTDYWVLNTDYVNYALVYTCFNVNDYQMRVGTWKLSRTKQLLPASATAINTIINSVSVLDQSYYKFVDQSPEACFYFPQPQAGVPVVFPGQCDTNIQAMPNFNIQQFAGRWYEIEAYPKIEQPGQCINHQFSVTSTTSYSLNSQNVVNRILTSTTGQVTLNPNQNTGRLTITITGPQGPITIPYWILNTDYQNYALAYSCVNYGTDFKGVWSWKLSRTKQLSAASNTQINNAIQNNVVLDNRYYETIDQSDNACFHYPNLGPTDPVVFPGLCDPNVPVVPNFDASRYLGKWRMIENYHSDFQFGTCGNAEYSLDTDGTVIAFNTEVVNQRLTNMTGRGVIVGNAKLSVTFPNAPIPVDYWVLDTDYDSYALVYSCVNDISRNERRVFSWKLSRTNSLSTNAINNINRIVNSVDVLDNRYYQKVDRTDAGCFYYPETDGQSTVLFRGQCNENIPVVTGFDAGRYLGLWHDIESYPGEFQFGSCMNANYSIRPDGKVDVFNTQVINQNLLTIRGAASVVPSNDGSAKLEVSFSDEPGNLTNYWVLSTDYDTYSLVYSCRNINDEYQAVYLWKLSRTKTLTNNAITQINRVISNFNVMDQRYFVKRDQSPEGCFYFPQPQAGVPVVFPGQCDTNIQAMPNFNIQQFAGRWYEIEAYPKIEQPGQCINHQFSVTSTTSYSLNSQNVVNRILTSTTGQVTLNPNQNTGRLTITITGPQGPITIPYWILNTDYQNYALAYSCVNYGTDFRGVWSWKLSRTKQLSAASNTQINNAIQNNVVLDNQYYENIDQSDNACFHYPNLGPTDPVVFPGLCDPNVPVVPNFDASRYLGKWRMIENYHSDFQFGTCGNAEYSLDTDGTVIAFNTEVVNQRLTNMTGRGVIVGNAKLSVTFPNAPIPVDYWVLDTDYDSYALVYSCVNDISRNERRVFSWKLSRTNSLSTNAINNINRIVNSVDVLDNRYYQKVDRTDAGCFYYPETDGQSTVLFRGQCNENIPVVTGFDAGRYLGLWHDIESYPGEFQFGSCMNANYSIRPDGKVDVFNTQVINQNLLTIRGAASVVPSNDGSAKLEVSFSDEPGNLTNYWVLSTDYDTYSLVYSCRNINDEYQAVYLWKLSRTKTLTNNAITQINRVISNFNVMDQRYFVKRDQSPEGCFYFPQPQAGVPVVFPGQCDTNIQAMPNFNIQQFAGRWYEIEAYPKIEQPGQCINHQFSVTSTTSYSLNSQNVVNRILTSTTGQVTLNPNQNTGRLTITITGPQGPITIPYWILNTDYQNYALAYSCVNYGTDFRGVWSWKLSRTKQLSAASNTQINNAIQNNVVLDNRYYETIDQSDNACFHYPNLGPTDPVVFPGLCDPNVPVVPNFDASRYLGKWRMIENYYSDFQFGTCGNAEYSLDTDGTVIAFNTEVVNQRLTNMTGRGVIVGNAKLSVTFPNAPIPVDYWVLDTDYDSYALVYSCVNDTSRNERRVFSWKLSRTNSLSTNAINNINRIVNSVDVLDDRYYQKVDRTNAGCFYFPTPGEGTTVIFPGQCDENIPVVTGFNPQAYQGLWHDVESYPTPFQVGTCNRAYYTLTPAGIVDVMNTEVVDQFLEVTNGTAVLVTTDLTAKLDVTFDLPIGRVTAKYWILDTDYTSYSLVYSCRNIDDFYRAVFVWKLGRQPTLTNAAITAINNKINSIDVLDQRYFIQRRHSAEDCFYYPDNQGGDVILDGECVPDAQVPAVTNFNANQFAGTWYEVARFPSTLQNGECAATQYTQSGNNAFTVTQTSVVNEQQLTTTAQASVASNGRGVITATISGVPFNNVYILGTDYSEYALAYSCRNLGNNKKQVYSWKLSRSRAGLSSAANNTINQLVSNNVDLFERYYRYTGQDNAACFYYPVFDQLPATIELPGPCDTTIRGKANFNTAAYLGRWFEIARYPQRAQTGQCNRAEYSDIGGAVGVYNTQVVNGVLASQSGSAVPISTDNSGLLEVTFVVNGETRKSNYYVLDTDYTSYSLVYSCMNLANGNRQVGSWKLSRSRSLSTQANTAIDAIIRQTQGLNERYYLTTDQSDNACFYVPEVNATQAPLFRGQCEDITGMAGFDMTRYLGWWHEIERYPVDGEAGDCISSRYQTSGNTIQVVDTSVFGLSANTVQGTVTVTNNGRLRRTLSNNRVQDIWVLATDYNSYALLYSCENVNNEYRRVWSAKHSKSRSLTAAAQAAMAPTINSNKLLYPQFYQTVDQTNEACFHYPTQTGAQVILPGQCDTNIPIVPNFAMENFAGTWYEIERYDDIGASSCIGTRFTYDANSGSITVLQFEVVGGELVTRQGSAQLSASGSGLLIMNVTNPATNAPVTIPLFILSTDYENYALAFTCENVDPFQRRVGAWKLSRQRSMSSVGATSINTLITQRPELHQPYFKLISHNDDCLEPSSSFLVKSSMIVILVCGLLQLLL